MTKIYYTVLVGKTINAQISNHQVCCSCTYRMGKKRVYYYIFVLLTSPARIILVVYFHSYGAPHTNGLCRMNE